MSIEDGNHLPRGKRPWCWERLRAGGEGDNRGWNGWMAAQTQWTWVWASCGRWWRTGKPGVLQSMGLQRASWLSNWTTRVNSPYFRLWRPHLSQSCIFFSLVFLPHPVLFIFSFLENGNHILSSGAMQKQAGEGWIWLTGHSVLLWLLPEWTLGRSLSACLTCLNFLQIAPETDWCEGQGTNGTHPKVDGSKSGSGWRGPVALKTTGVPLPHP